MSNFGKTKDNEKERQNWLRENKPIAYKKVLEYPEKVSKGESVAIIQFQYDYKCNFQCEHCCISKFRYNKNKKKFTMLDIKNLADQAHNLGLANFVITGGEPLIFKEFDDIVTAINPERFFLVTDTNGWFLDYKKAKHLKEIGIDKVQLSLDGVDKEQHDKFRNKPGSWQRAVNAIDACKKANLHVILSTVVWKERVHSRELIDFLEFAKQKEVGTYISYAKPVGNFEGKFDLLIDEKDEEYVENLGKKYDVFTHLTPSYGLNLGCIAVKRIISITQFGDVQPCPYIHVSLGNVFKEPLKDILQRSLEIDWFSYKNKFGCICASDKKFIENVVKKTYGENMPVDYKKIF
jgi:MoaA/NifB/PqqE/SkfB family radical SAM enzyme